MINLDTILEIIAILIGVGVGADVILNYMLKSTAVTAIDAINNTTSASINAITGTTQAGINAILNMSVLNDVNHLANQKINHQTSQSNQPQTKS